MAEKNDKKPEEDKTAASATGAAPTAEKKKLPQLGALEDDDEFEDFPASAEQSTTVADGLAAGAPGADQLWEDNWDDDDIEDDFQKQLRQAIAERSGGDEAMKE